MAFKLIDNPGSSDNKRNRRNRATNIIKHGIPYNEYEVNRSGKIACVVCPSWPVFDTFAVLSCHRNSVKHKAHKRSWDAHLLDKQFEKEKFLNKQAVRREAQKHEESSAPLIETAKDAVHALYSTSDHVAQGTKDQSLTSQVILDHGSRTQYHPQENTTSIQGHFSTIGATFHEVLNSGESSRLSNAPMERKSSPTKRVSVDNKEAIEAKRLKMMQELKLRKSGWIKDSSGNWVKDENCEFDSDEEAPGD